jgi:hypothetical protein
MLAGPYSGPANESQELSNLKYYNVHVKAMRLTVGERSILDGKEGRGRQKAMEILETLGEIFEADGLIPIRSAQVSGVSYKNLGDAGLEFIAELAQDCKVTVTTTLNPAGTDLERWKEMGVTEDFFKKQDKVIKAYERLGIIPSCSCTPYYDANIPKKGEHLAWGESSAVCYVNSIIGARTNREGGPSALAAAIVGKTPNYGLHKDENRRTGLIIEVEAGIKDLAALGYKVGALVGERVPFFRGIDKGIRLEDLKAMCAALAASGSVALFHVEGLTPEAGSALNGPSRSDIETVPVSKADVEETAAKLSTTDGKVELVAIGCPHLSPKELKKVASILKDKRPRPEGPKLWVCTSRASRKASKEAVKVIERFGPVLCDTCMVVSPIEGLFRSTATNSAKAAHYLVKDGYGNQKVRYGTLEEVLALLY